MSATLWTALLLQSSAVILLRHRLGKTWLRRPVVLLVLASVVYQGVSPVLMAFPSIGRWDVYRQGVAGHFIDQATLIMSGGMLAFTFCYLLTRPERVMAVPEPGEVRLAAKVLDWRLLALACAPLAVLTYDGRGYNNAVAQNASTALSTNLASTFFVIAVALTAFSLVLRHGTRWFLPALIAQSLLLAAAGERTPLIIDAITLIVLLSHAGMPPGRRQLRTAAVLTVLGALAITGVRAEQGRSLFYGDSGFGARVSALAGGLSALGTSQPGDQGPGLIAQAALRLDGTDFAGDIQQSEHLGQPRLPASDIPDSLLLAVPSATWDSKLTHAAALNPTMTETHDFALNTNLLPVFAGLYYGFLSPAWLIVFLGALGATGGIAERRLMRGWSASRMILLAGAVTAALWSEVGLPGMLVIMRPAVVGAVAVTGIQVLLFRRSHRAMTPPQGYAHSYR